MKTIRCCKVTLTRPARVEAIAALSVASPHYTGKREDFTGPDFQDVYSVDVGIAVVRVRTTDGEVYTYPLHMVARIKEYNKEVAK
jgi:hypothetical protein